jgi:hypothetical protein
MERGERNEHISTLPLAKRQTHRHFSCRDCHFSCHFCRRPCHFSCRFCRRPCHFSCRFCRRPCHFSCRFCRRPCHFSCRDLAISHTPTPHESPISPHPQIKKRQKRQCSPRQSTLPPGITPGIHAREPSLSPAFPTRFTPGIHAGWPAAASRNRPLCRAPRRVYHASVSR